MQVKLLRMLEERTFTRIGGSKPISVDVRFVCATHRDLTQLIAEQKFREDLYYRINVFPIILPPLKERLADIPDLVRFIIERFEAQGFPKAPILTDGALDALKSYEWPGNVRELRNILERAGALFVGRAIDFATMAGLIRPGQPIDRAEEAEAIWDAVAEFAEDPVVSPENPDADEMPARPVDVAINNDAGVRTILSARDGFNLKDYVSALEIAFIRVALEDEDGSVSAAARRLGIQRTTLIEKMRKFGIGRPD
jgi:sigma-54 specific flagellar transcriptional regulator A